MDAFAELISELEGLSPEKRAQRIGELEGDCVCPICPTFNQCAKEAQENIFCLRGKSKDCVTKERGCICPTCPFGIKFRIGVIYNFFCLRGSQLEQQK